MPKAKRTDDTKIHWLKTLQPRKALCGRKVAAGAPDAFGVYPEVRLCADCVKRVRRGEHTA